MTYEIYKETAGSSKTTCLVPNGTEIGKTYVLVKSFETENFEAAQKIYTEFCAEFYPKK